MRVWLAEIARPCVGFSRLHWRLLLLRRSLQIQQKLRHFDSDQMCVHISTQHKALARGLAIRYALYVESRDSVRRHIPNASESRTGSQGSVNFLDCVTRGQNSDGSTTARRRACERKASL